MQHQQTKHIVSIIQQESQAHELIQSIEKKFNTLFEPHINRSTKEKQKQPLIRSENKTITDRMQLAELQQSFNTPQKKNRSVLNQINKMEAFYVQKIKCLEYKVFHLENQNEQLKKKLQEVRTKYQKNEIQLRGLKNFNQTEMQNAIRQVEKILIKKFGDEAAQFYHKAEQGKEIIKQQLIKQKTYRIRIEDKLEQLQEEKDNLQVFYRNLVQNHRRLLRADIQKTKFDLRNKSSYAGSIDKSYDIQENIKQQIEQVKGKTKQLKKANKRLKKQLPNVANEVKSLKTKLKIQQL